jgi:hypothetical protein
MAKPQYTPPRVFVDGVEMATDNSIAIDRQIHTYSYDMLFEIERAQESNVDVTLKCQYGTLKFRANAYETADDGTIYFYGPLRQMFPDLFKDKELLEWQKAYLNAYRVPPWSHLKLWRDAPLFKEDEADNFRRGFELGKKAGKQ